MNEQTAARLVPAPLHRVRRVLLEPLGLPEWNPAIVSLTGPAQAQTGTRYPIVAKGGLRGFWTYPAIGEHRILTQFKVNGLEESGWWTLEPRGDDTMVEHGFSHRGALALLLSAAFRGVADLRLDRLAERSVASGDQDHPGRTPA
jgi:hypothetical protein